MILRANGQVMTPRPDELRFQALLNEPIAEPNRRGVVAGIFALLVKGQESADGPMFHRRHRRRRDGPQPGGVSAMGECAAPRSPPCPRPRPPVPKRGGTRRDCALVRMSDGLADGRSPIRAGVTTTIIPARPSGAVPSGGRRDAVEIYGRHADRTEEHRKIRKEVRQLRHAPAQDAGRHTKARRPGSSP